MPTTSPPRLRLTCLAVGLLSAAVIALELLLMRCLRVATWSHLTYVVISTALLGFGASGTFLTLIRDWAAARWRTVFAAMAMLFAIAVPVGFTLAQQIPIDIRQLPYGFDQIDRLVLVHVLVMLPFFFAATAVGLTLIVVRDHVPAVYAANLIGSGLGAPIAIALMACMPAEQSLWAVAAAGLLVAMLMTGRQPRRLVAAVGSAAVIAWLTWPMELRVDPYKPLAHMHQLVQQGDATIVDTWHGPRGRIDLLDAPSTHVTLFASPVAPLPPRQRTIVIDGAVQLPVFLVQSLQDAAVLDHTPMAIPYRLATPKRVLLLGEAGGTNVWLARRFGADSITVVQPDARLLRLMATTPAEQCLVPLSGPGTHAVTAGSRAFVERTGARFDLIQVCDLEAMTAGSAGLSALDENFLVTVQGFARCLSRLADDGLLCVTRGIQHPPRDNIKLLATLIDALGSLGIDQPSQHIIQVRNYLAVCTMASRRPLTDEQVHRLRHICDEMATDVIWYPGITSDQPNRHAIRPGPEGTSYDYYHHAALQLLWTGRRQFYATWAFNVEPATDDRPFFFDFWTWRVLPLLRDAYGPGWLARTELGYLAVILALIESAIVATILILLPLRWVRHRGEPSGGRAATFGYFAALGLAYMLIEMALITRLGQLLDDPIITAAVVLGAFLVCSGIGSLIAQQLTSPPVRVITFAIVGICSAGVLYLLAIDPLCRAVAGAALPLRVVIALVTLAPLAVAMGVPFPQGLMLLHAYRPTLTPWAWAVNGFASVIATSLALVLATSVGFRGVLVAALILYALAAVLPAGIHTRAQADPP